MMNLDIQLAGCLHDPLLVSIKHPEGTANDAVAFDIFAFPTPAEKEVV